MSATRSEPLALDEDGLPLQARIRTEAESTALNVAAILRETWEDFRNADRYFKFKAAILAAWAVLSLAGVFVACPGAPTLGAPSSALGARLILGEQSEHPAYVLSNESDRAWEDVVVVVNHAYRAAISHVEPRAFVTVTPKQLMGDNGKLAPFNLKATELELHTRKGSVVLLRDGQPQ
ncbi:MAG TPA: hypothetical protein VLQ79_06620 [Myxococcaceae bacterium]|nr:hypothetical protein [Myxococcaceae bacterium]